MAPPLNIPDRGHMYQVCIGFEEQQNAKHTQAWHTRRGLADGGVIGAEFKAIGADTVEAAMCVDTVLRTGVGGCALVYVHTGLTVPLKLETRMTPALEGPRGQEKCQNQQANNSLSVNLMFAFSFPERPWHGDYLILKKKKTCS